MYSLKNHIVYLSSKRSVLITLFTSFIILTLIPLIIWGFFYKKTESIMKENVNRYNIAMLEQVKHIMDGNLQETERTAYQISFSSKLHNIISIDYPPDVSNTYQYIDFKNELAVYKRTNTFISDFYVYFPKDDVILMPDMKTNSSTFYGNFYKYMEIDYNSWIEILNSYHYKYYLPVTSSPQ